jgi:hypothetical protein
MTRTNQSRSKTLRSNPVRTADYRALLGDIKSRIRTAQIKASLAVNRELIQLYWDIGRLIVQRQQTEGWGASVIDRLAGDLQRAFPGLQGFSASNISRMRALFLAYASHSENSAQAVPKSNGQKSARLVPKMTNATPPSAVAGIPLGA